MARIIEWTKKQQRQWDKWVSSRPPIIQDLCKRLPPYNLYLLKTSDHKVTIYSYSENGTLTVNVTGKYNAMIFDRQVFGIKPDDLEECDMPRMDEPVGTLLIKKKDVETFIDMVRPAIVGNKKFVA
jgi:hypothetical protein